MEAAMALARSAPTWNPVGGIAEWLLLAFGPILIAFWIVRGAPLGRRRSPQRPGQSHDSPVPTDSGPPREGPVTWSSFREGTPPEDGSLDPPGQDARRSA